ncbi:MAG: class I SAM-dependent methyltransferase [Gemmatimonadetes bacterium]|nr:class I SAM-dependent methyltransferase [Gemmatimonadota bacterium]
MREELAGSPEWREDRERARSVLAARQDRSRAFFSASADRWDALRGDLYGARADLLPLFGLLEPDWVVGDLGCGTGQLAAALAPFVARVVAVDRSPEMLAAARDRLAGLDNVELREGELEALPLEDATLGLAVVSLVLHFVGSPGEALAEAARVLAPGGRLVVVDMRPHGREGYREEMGHVWPGFSGERLLGWMEDAGLEGARVHPIPPDPQAKGPLLFVAHARRPMAGGPDGGGRLESKRPALNR